MPPGVRHRGRIERVGHRANLRQLEQPGAFGNQQTDGELDRRDVLDEPESIDCLEQRAVRLEGGPWGEGDECRREGQAGLAAQRHRALESRSRVPLLELFQHVIVYGLDGARHERAARVAQNGQRVGVGEQMLDLDRDVVRDLRKLRMERAATATAWRMPLKKSGSPNVMCRAPSATCASDVCHDDLRGHYPEAPVVDGHNRAVTATVLAAAARFGRPGNPHDVTHTQLGVAGERR